MKHRLICLVILFVFCCFSASAAVYSPGADAFSITYPDDWTIDDSSQASGNTDMSLWLCNFSSSHSIIELDMQDYRSLYGALNLFDATQLEINTYMRDIEDSFTSYGETAVYLETKAVPFGDTSIPFLIYQVTGGENGDYYCRGYAGQRLGDHAVCV